MMKIIKTFDFFGDNPKLKIKSKDLYQTKIGGLLSLLFIICFLIIDIYYIAFYLSKRNETLFYLPKTCANIPVYDISFGDDMNIFIGILKNDSTINYTLNKQDVDITVVKKSYVKNQFIKEETEKINYEIKPFSIEGISKNNLLVYSLLFNEKIKIGGDLLSNNVTSFMKISINFEAYKEIFVFYQEKKFPNSISNENSSFSVNLLNKQDNLLKIYTKKILSSSYESSSINNKHEISLLNFIPYLTFQNNSNLEIILYASNIIESYEARKSLEYDSILSNVLSWVIITYHTLLYLNKILTYNSSWLYLVNYFFRYSNINSDTNYMKLLLFKDRDSYQVSRTINPLNNAKARTSIVSKDIEGSEIINLNENSYHSIKKSVSKNINSNGFYVNSQNSLMSDSKKGLDLENLGSQNMYHLAPGINDKKLDLSNYKDKIFTFLENLSKNKIKLKFYEKILPLKYSRKSIINFNNSKKILLEYLSIERYVKSITDLEKIKKFLFDNTQLNFFNLHYLNSYVIQNNKEVVFKESELIEVLKGKLADKQTRATNNKLIQMFNNEMLSSIN